MVRIFLFTILISTLFACASKPKNPFSEYTPPPSPDYSQSENWAALPTKKDQADRTPQASLLNMQDEAEADVFWLHPTTYLKKRGNNQWNAPTNDSELNKITDEGSILNQASIFNGAGKVYAPRYRQGHIEVYYTKDKVAAKKALSIAYDDVKSAFEYYLQQYNPVNSQTGKRRPIIIASHSQGTTHAAQLLLDYFDGKDLQNDLIAAYLVGMPVPKDYFKNIKVCEAPEETDCFCTWRTWKYGHFPKDHIYNNDFATTNPLTWTTTTTPAPKTLNKGSVLRKFEKSFKKNLVDAQINDGILWAHKPKFPGSFFITFKNYHIADLNFYYVNVRENAIARTKAFLKKNK